MNKAIKTNSPVEKLLLDKIENKYQFVIKVSSYIKELQKKLGKEKTRKEIIEQALRETVSKEKAGKKLG